MKPSIAPGLVIVAMWATVALPTSVSAVAGDRVHHPADTTRVLFIGNSYTYVNNLPAVFSAVAAAAGRPVVADMVVAPGATLAGLWRSGASAAALDAADWDFVVLQEQSTLGTRMIDGSPVIQDDRYFHAAVREYVAEIRAAGAHPLLFMTWPRRDDPATLQTIARAYLEIGRELGVPVAPVGLSFPRLTRDGAAALYMDDGAHPSPAGSLLAALTIYSTLFNAAPLSAASVPAQVSGAATDMSGIVYTDSTTVLVELAPDELGVLASSSAAAVEMFRQNDGYIRIPEPVEPTLPQAPAADMKTSLGVDDVVGVWRGPIRLLAAPSEMQLTIGRENDAEALSVTWEMLFPNARFNQTVTVSDFRIVNDQVLFTVTGLPMMPGETTYRGVLRNEQIVGVAEHLADDGQTQLVAGWTLAPYLDRQ